MFLSMVPVFLVVCLVRLGEGQDWLPVWARSYGDDLAVIPLVLWLILLVHRRVRKNQSWVLPIRHGVLALLFFLIIFEWILPEIMGRGTADLWDGLMYSLGLVYFQSFVNQVPKKIGTLRFLPFIWTI